MSNTLKLLLYLPKKLLRGTASLILILFRFKAEPLPENINKAVVVIAPHTSNWDFFILCVIKFKYGLTLNWFAKGSMFKFPFAKMLKMFGGIPIDRSKDNNIVDELVANFETHEKLLLAITPEGTRKHRDYWKSGFYHVAQQAQVPIIFYVLDYQNRLARVANVMTVSNIENDFELISKMYSKSQAKYPDQFSDIKLKQK
ncbi:1-acyl-sn-glycerol-3-phosphate acyltransferase [Francisellaceae bacterium]|nr:1-acyl-sn-glycerol-3-phosphate acyltransferase [Francisellaceae bacterium]